VGLLGRLARLEKQAALRRAQEPLADGDTDPPCPPWFDPQEWASRMRLSRLLMRQFTTGAEAQAEPKGTTDEERRCAEGLAGIFQQLANDPGCNGP